MKLIGVLLLFFSLNAGAENVSLPASVPSPDDIISEFRTQIVTKLVDLGKNYISTIGNNVLVFTNSEAMKCNDMNVHAGESLASIQYNTKQKDNQLSEQVVYTGCNAQISLIEDVITYGQDLSPLKFSDILKGTRSVELKSNESRRIYKLSNGEGEEIFSVVIEKGVDSQAMLFSILQQKFLTINFKYEAAATRAVLTYFGYSASYVRKYGRWGMNRRMDPSSISVFARKNGQVQYFNNDGNLISLSGFVNSFNKNVMENTVQTITDILEYHTYYFPKTESTKTGNQSQRFIDDLRLAQNRLLSNTDITLVKNLIQELISAAELGQITDNRPKKN
jgi:hypothetical protein